MAMMAAPSSCARTRSGLTTTDELAAAAGKDPLEYLRQLLGEPRHVIVPDYPNYGAPLDQYPIDTGRLRGVLDLVAANIPLCSVDVKLRHRDLLVKFVAPAITRRLEPHDAGMQASNLAMFRKSALPSLPDSVRFCCNARR